MPKWLTTVTPFSKMFALSLFIMLPIVGSILGYRYGLIVGKINLPIIKEIVVTTKPIPTSIPFQSVSSKDWKRFTSKKHGYSFYYPLTYYMSEEKTIAMDDKSYWIEVKSRKDIPVYGANKNDLDIEIIVKPIIETTTLESTGNDIADNRPYESQSNLIKTVISGVPALRWKTIDGPSSTGKWVKNNYIEDRASQEIIIFIYKNYKYSIIKFPADTLRQNEFEEILSSFRLN